MTKDEALKLALEALVLNNDEWKSLADSGDSGYWKAEDQDHYKQTNEAITAIKEALVQPEQRTVQVLPLEFVEIVMDKEHLVGNPIVWAQWPNKEKTNG